MHNEVDTMIIQYVDCNVLDLLSIGEWSTHLQREVAFWAWLKWVRWLLVFLLFTLIYFRWNLDVIAVYVKVKLRFICGCSVAEKNISWNIYLSIPGPGSSREWHYQHQTLLRSTISAEMSEMILTCGGSRWWFVFQWPRCHSVHWWHWAHREAPPPSGTESSAGYLEDLQRVVTQVGVRIKVKDTDIKSRI